MSRRVYRVGHALLLAAGLLILGGCSEKVVPLDPEIYTPAPGKYDVRILRDTWGVPHIFGKTDAAVAYGLAYANCEDDFKTIEQGQLLSRAKLASVERFKMAPFDYLVALFRVRELVAERYESDLSVEVRAVCEAYADGVNHYAALHPEEVSANVFPATGQDLVVGFAMKAPLFFGLDKTLKLLMAGPVKKQGEVKVAWAEDTFFTHDAPIGSNTFAVSPRRTPDGKTHLDINSHQPWTGPVSWYEAHLKSEEGLDIVGGVFPGSPVILHGHNRDLGWAHTVNHPDLVDVYELEMNPANPNQYKYDGEWRDLEQRSVKIPVRLWGSLRWTVTREVLYAVQGPVIRRPHGVYAIRYAGYDNIRQVEQWFRMGKSRNIQEFEQALRIRGIPSFNIGYADKEGNIWYIYNTLSPVRAEGYDWQGLLPGNTSKTMWTEYIPFEQMPQVKNPSSGFVQNCNSSPFRTTLDPENPKPEDFSPTLGIEGPEEMTNRGLRLLELLSADDSITEEEFERYKWDRNYSTQSQAEALRQKILGAAPTDDPVVEQAREALRQWNLGTEPENPNTAIAILTMEPIVRAEMFGGKGPELLGLFSEKAHLLQNTFGRIDVPWQEVNRLVRGSVNLGLGGGPDVLNAVYGEWKKDHLEGMAGDCYVLLVTWDAQGQVHSRALHQFGSATMDAASPHYADQSPLFVRRELRPVWMDEAVLRAHLESEYRPGEPRPAAQAKS